MDVEVLQTPGTRRLAQTAQGCRQGCRHFAATVAVCAFAYEYRQEVLQTPCTRRLGQITRHRGMGAMAATIAVCVFAYFNEIFDRLWPVKIDSFKQIAELEEIEQ
jgi:hypothetical protein